MICEYWRAVTQRWSAAPWCLVLIWNKDSLGIGEPHLSDGAGRTSVRLERIAVGCSSITVVDLRIRCRVLPLGVGDRCHIQHATSLFNSRCWVSANKWLFRSIEATNRYSDTLKPKIIQCRATSCATFLDNGTAMKGLTVVTKINAEHLMIGL